MSPLPISSNSTAKASNGQYYQDTANVANDQKLLKQLIRLPEALEAAVNNYKPNLLTNYLFELAQTFNSFYAAVPVLKTHRNDIKASRLKLTLATSLVLKNGLNMLGLASFERM